MNNLFFFQEYILYILQSPNVSYAEETLSGLTVATDQTEIKENDIIYLFIWQQIVLVDR